MSGSRDVGAVLVTGCYGAGKSTVVADMGALLGGRGQPYGLVDVDWLGWFDAGGSSSDHERVVLGNVTRLCTSFLDEGVTRLVLAWSVRDKAHLHALREAVPAPMRVVRLDVGEEVVTGRLSADPTEERREDDLGVALDWLATGRGVGLEDLLLPGDRAVRETAVAICAWLGWI